MINGIIGKKVGMTQIFAADGTVTPVTVIKAGPCIVVQKKSSAGKDGYNAVQLGLVEDKPVKLKNVTKPMRGHFEKTGGGVPPTRVLKEFRLEDSADPTNVGDKVLVDQFADGDAIEVIGRSKGRGFAGTVKRHNFNRGPESHGSMNVRAPGTLLLPQLATRAADVTARLCADCAGARVSHEVLHGRVNQRLVQLRAEDGIGQFEIADLFIL